MLEVDEHFAPQGCKKTLLMNAPIEGSQTYPMPVGLDDSQAAATEYSFTLEKLAGSPPVIDLVHLGLGPDGHTLRPHSLLVSTSARALAQTPS